MAAAGTVHIAAGIVAAAVDTVRIAHHKRAVQAEVGTAVRIPVALDSAGTVAHIPAVQVAADTAARIPAGRTVTGAALDSAGIVHAGLDRSS